VFADYGPAQKRCDIIDVASAAAQLSGVRGRSCADLVGREDLGREGPALVGGHADTGLISVRLTL